MTLRAMLAALSLAVEVDATAPAASVLLVVGTHRETSVDLDAWPGCLALYATSPRLSLDLYACRR